MFLMLSCRLTKTNAHDNVSYIDKVFGMSGEFILILVEVRRAFRFSASEICSSRRC